MYLVSKSAVKRRHGDYGDNGDMEKGLTTLCDKVDAIAVAGREADDRHCASLVRCCKPKSLRLRRRVNDRWHELWLTWDPKMSKRKSLLITS
jgi:hypothetical protein